MSLQSFTRKFDDHSTEAGFQFTFYCDISADGYKTKFIESKTGKKAGLFRAIGKGVSVGTSIVGKVPISGIPGVGKPGEKDSDLDLKKAGEKSGDLLEEISKKYQGMSAEWHKEHDLAFETVQNEAKQNFNRCPKCKRWVCEYCWNEQEGVCIEHTQNASTSMSSAKVDESKKIICSQCNQPAGTGKFCSNCGVPLYLKCSNCGAQSALGTKFCNECGTKLG